MQAFLSYAHEDSAHLIRLKKSIAQIKRDGLLSDWYDRDIPFGGVLDEEIRAKLADSFFFICLISPDYLASAYCMDVELVEAKDQNKLILPIIIRDSDWLNSSLKPYKALPEDGEPIESADNSDKAWQQVVNGLRDRLKTTDSLINTTGGSTGEAMQSILHPEFDSFLADPGTTLLHAHGKALTLDDLFVYPEIERSGLGAEVTDNLIRRGTELLKANEDVIIFGEEQAGRTSLCKKLYRDFLVKGKTPLLLKGEDIKKSDLDSVIGRAIKRQYSSQEIEVDVLIIDDLHRCPLNFESLENGLRSIRKLNMRAVLCADESFRYACQDIEILKDYELYSIQNFNQERKAALIEKWVVFGREETITPEEKYSEIDRIKTQISDVMGRNIIPSKPIYLLSVLQALETVSQTDLQLTSYAHCYHYLIIAALKKSGAKPKEFDGYINFLTSLAFYIHSENDAKELSEEEEKKFLRQYEARYVFSDKKNKLERLRDSRILKNIDGGLGFQDNYIYYFYVAKFIAENLSYDEKRKSEIINILLSDLHIEENANIIVFIAHHSRDPHLLERIMEAMGEMFSRSKEASLAQAEVRFLGDLVHSIPKIVLEQRDTDESRKQKYEREEALIKQESKLSEDVRHMSPEELPAQIYRAFKAIEICGQIIRNRFASLDRDALTNLVGATYSVGTRFTGFYLGALESMQMEIIEFIERMMREDPDADSSAVEREAKSLILWASFGTIYGAVKRLASCVGTKECMPIYEAQSGERGTPVAKLVEAYIRLFCARDLNATFYEKLYYELEGNAVCQRILKCFVVEFIYLNNVPYQKRQKLSQAVKVVPNTQRALNQQ
jgi:hypothetical protein